MAGNANNSQLFGEVAYTDPRGDVWVGSQITAEVAIEDLILTADYGSSQYVEASLTPEPNAYRQSRIFAEIAATAGISDYGVMNSGVLLEASIEPVINGVNQVNFAIEIAVEESVIEIDPGYYYPFIEENTLMARAFNTKISGDQITIEARSGFGTGGLDTNADGALKADWSVVADKSSVEALISAEASTRGSADTSLTTRVSSEEVSRAAGDSSLTVAVSTEASSRVAGDLSLTNRVSAEESARTAGDSSLTAAVSAEASSRVAGDS